MTDETKTYPKGDELLRAAVNQIILHPETWNQRSWHCGTTHCIGGWAQILGGCKKSDSAPYDAERLLELSSADAQYLFHANRNIYEIYSFAKTRLSGKVDRAGFDRAGFNRDGSRLELVPL